MVIRVTLFRADCRYPLAMQKNKRAKAYNNGNVRDVRRSLREEQPRYEREYVPQCYRIGGALPNALQLPPREFRGRRTA